MSQGNLADTLSYKSKSAITKIEHGEQKISYKRLDDFAEALGTSKEYLTDGWILYRIDIKFLIFEFKES